MRLQKKIWIIVLSHWTIFLISLVSHHLFTFSLPSPYLLPTFSLPTPSYIQGEGTKKLRPKYEINIDQISTRKWMKK